MNDRLEKLLHQREILREHLRWLEGEIEATRENAGLGEAPTGVPQTSVAPLTPASPSKVDRAPADDRSPSEPASELAQIPEPDLRGLRNEVHQGCLLYVAFFALVGAAMVGLIFLIY